jgi:hypothetical protein
MSEDLLLDFFKRKLTEAEKTRLGELIESSPEAADRFAALAEEDYKASGYPDPVKISPDSIFYLSEGRLVLLAGLIGLVIIAAVCKLYLSCSSEASVAVSSQAVAPQADSSALEDSMSQKRPLRQSTGDWVGKDLTQTIKAKKPLPQLKITLPSEGAITIELFGLDGARVRLLAKGTYPAGVHRFPWDGKDDIGRKVPSGSYRAVILRGGERTEVTLRVNP